ncbi:MAG: hypothetical protein JW803_04290 [Endomicrobiales bacterium]|nr:hypothetical protein [Endomicrobiales bacterium]
MFEFRYMHGAVYILKNIQAQRVKVGMTTNNVADRLSDVNDKWLEQKVTCQICGGRLVNVRGYVPKHVASSNYCLGGNALPLEKNVALAETYLESLKNRLSEVSGSEKGSITRKINTLKKRIELFRNYIRPAGGWQFGAAYYTDCAEQVELLTHKILADRLDKDAPFGEVFCCSVSEAMEAVEKVLNQLGLLQSARKEVRL